MFVSTSRYLLEGTCLIYVVCVQWCTTHIALCFYFVFRSLVCPMLSISLDCPFLISHLVFSSVYLGHSLTTFLNTEFYLYGKKNCPKRFICYSSFNQSLLRHNYVFGMLFYLLYIFSTSFIPMENFTQSAALTFNLKQVSLNTPCASTAMST